MSSRIKYETLEELIREPGTISKMTKVGLDVILNEGILYRKRRLESEVAFSFHLTDKEGKTGFMKKHGFFWGLGALLENGRIGIIYKQKLNRLLERGITKEDLKKFIRENKVWKGEVKIKEAEIEDYCKEKGFEFPNDLEKEEKMKLFRQFIFTQAAFKQLVKIPKSYGIRGIYLAQNKILPLKRIPKGFIKAILKREYSEGEKEVIKKYGDNVDFYEFEEEKGDFVLKN